jgi:dolichol-phosphate mannosyltransferase
MEISVVLPAYKEAENLKNIIPRLHEVLKRITAEYEIIIVDTVTGMDNTAEVCSELGAVCVHREGGNLYGDAIRTGFSKATGKYITVMDADGSHDPNDIERFYNEMKDGDLTLVIGSRYCKGGHTDNNFILIFMSWILNMTYRIFFKLKINDISDSYRMYRAKDIKGITLECDNFDIVEEILIKLRYTTDTFKVKEIPISFNKRAAGESKRDLLKFIKSYIKTIRRLLKIKNNIARADLKN